MKIILFFTLFTFLNHSRAAEIQQIKNNKVLLLLDDDTTSPGDEFYALDANGKKIGLLQVSQIKNGKAVAIIKKGRAEKNGQTELIHKQAKKKIKNQDLEDTYDNEGLATNTQKMKFSLSYKYMMNGITTEQEDSLSRSETVQMTGSNSGFMLAADFPAFSSFDLRGTLSYDLLDVKATSTNLSCDTRTSTDCNTKITYLTLAGFLKYNMMNESNFNPWIALGASYRNPMSKSSTALTEDDIQAANTIILALGFDAAIGASGFIPVSAEYHHSLNTSESVPKITQINITLGYGIKF